jgi:hypothetical protein
MRGGVVARLYQRVWERWTFRVDWISFWVPRRWQKPISNARNWLYVWVDR